MICGCLVVQRYISEVQVFNCYHMISFRLSGMNRSKICPRMAEVVLACGKKEKQEIEETSPALLHVYQIRFVHII